MAETTDPDAAMARKLGRSMCFVGVHFDKTLPKIGNEADCGVCDEREAEALVALQAARADGAKVQREAMLKHISGRLVTLHRKHPWLVRELERTEGGKSDPMRFDNKRALVFGAAMELGLLDVTLVPDDDEDRARGQQGDADGE